MSESIFDVVFSKFPAVRVPAVDRPEAARRARQRAAEIAKEDGRDVNVGDLPIVEIRLIEETT